MWSNLLHDTGPVSNTLNDPLNSPGTDINIIIISEVMVNKSFDPLRHRYNSSLCLFTIRATFPIDHKSPLLPLDIIFREVRELRYS